jgi:shikimate kinase
MELIDEAKNIVLIGLMGSGKSTIGRTIAKKIGRRFVDTDRLIERKSGQTVAEIFNSGGEDIFRKLEKDAIKRVSQYIGIVVATGGGAIKDEENFRALKESGWIIALYASPETLYKRIEGKRIRPLLLQAEDPIKALENIYEERKGVYAKADFQINTDNKDITEISDEIIDLLRINVKLV